jgi:serine/threonine protein kinase
VTAKAHVGRFRLEEVLGAGGMALVYRAVDERTGRLAAVKLLADNLAADEAFRRRFQREARLAARLSHPNVVRVLDAGEYDGRPWLALEYVDGETLAQLLARRGRLSSTEVVALGRQLCAGLQHAHDAGLVHRDVKPANVLVRADGSATIVDFGIARPHEGTELTEHGSVLGTASYVAPELLTGGPVTAAADLYSLGAVLFEAASGVAVRPAGSLDELVARGAPPPAPRLREVVGDVRHLLAGSERPTAAVQTLVLPPQPQPLRHVSWSRPRALAAAIVLVALVVFLAWLAWPGGGSDEPAARPPATPREQARDLTRWLEQHS